MTGLVGLVAGCVQRPEERIIEAAGFHGRVRCEDVAGIERTSMCGLDLPRPQVDLLSANLGLKPLTVPERLGRVTNIVELPVECRVLHFDHPRPMTLSAVFDSPYALNDRTSGTQFASVLLTRVPSGATCLTFVREFR